MIIILSYSVVILFLVELKDRIAKEFLVVTAFPTAQYGVIMLMRKI